MSQPPAIQYGPAFTEAFLAQIRPANQDRHKARP